LNRRRTAIELKMEGSHRFGSLKFKSDRRRFLTVAFFMVRANPKRKMRTEFEYQY
jgi:hypothetical protein